MIPRCRRVLPRRPGLVERHHLDPEQRKVHSICELPNGTGPSDRIADAKRHRTGTRSFIVVAVRSDRFENSGRQYEVK
ncbi:hypothetical protein [Novipirellula caenicola]|uniref:hypothetical protein n=1 Tax=Novipirellula caenicola TaxID=1536901 RepID=UPI0031EBE2A5